MPARDTTSTATPVRGARVLRAALEIQHSTLPTAHQPPDNHLTNRLTLTTHSVSSRTTHSLLLTLCLSTPDPYATDSYAPPPPVKPAEQSVRSKFLFESMQRIQKRSVEESNKVKIAVAGELYSVCLKVREGQGHQMPAPKPLRNHNPEPNPRLHPDPDLHPNPRYHLSLGGLRRPE